MSLSRADVEKVAVLGRLRLRPDEIDGLQAQLGQIVEYVQSLAEVDTESIEPMAHAVERTNVFRADQVQPSLPREEALQNAPHRDRECYLVPAVLGD